MSHSTTRTPFTIGDYVVIDDNDCGNVTQIDESLRILSVFNSITNVTRISVPFTSCRPTTMGNETRLRSSNEHHYNAVTVTPPPLMPEYQSTRRTTLDQFKTVLLSARQ